MKFYFVIVLLRYLLNWFELLCKFEWIFIIVDLCKVISILSGFYEDFRNS